ncbi:7TM diverse intracellular signaling domain-containing protein [Pseudobacteriovorax antillogorgiicola]|uniref:Histidine kinase-, DNA gyrase B-, and HSP90-like ATPase n=1 Tax=Pseudobacteriovorax antillogorgiicola TaxID=1513793 RepID=A0A1Y6CRW0_9BACT|nr:7TM diverse intracellular signaling domain-containing protein [Pseudobacteriovorax antillogorgiicola]TCS45459.1 histidine kinase/DNA gyrase B/HSP90-like ATPase [Pseudobacteriovorax antillogorgiicola]SMF74730.1 Histidine kinase-, DNA gyrase B-, and HSP90-like ATPase [Pseudobacteriovorax antillogorgiicola]
MKHLIPIVCLILWGKSTSSFAQTLIKIDDSLHHYEAQAGDLAYFVSPHQVKPMAVDTGEFFALETTERKFQFLRDRYDQQYLKTGQPTLTDIISAENDGKFTLSDEAIPNFGVIGTPVWYHARLQYTGNAEKKLVELYFEGFLHDITIYVLDSSRTLLKTMRSGTVYPLSTRPNPDPSIEFVFPLEIRSDQGEVSIFIRNNGSPNSLNFQIFRNGEFRAQKNVYYLLYAVYFGSFIALILYNFCIFLISKELTYLYYVGYMMFAFLFLLFKNHLWVALFPDDNIVLWKPIFNISICFCLVFGLLFFRNFLRLSSFPRTDRFVKFCLILVATVFLYLEGSGSDPVFVLTFLSLSIYICQLIIATYLASQKRKEAIFYLIAFSAILIATILFALSALGIITKHPALLLAVEIGAFLEGFLLSLSMGEKLRIVNISLERYIGTVEELVESKTRHIDSVMRHINHGIFTVLPDGTIEDHYSKHLESVLGHSDIGGREPIELFLKETNLSSDELAKIDSVLRSSLNELSMNFAINSSHLPTEVVYRNKILELNWQSIENQESITEKILVVVRDITGLRELEHETLLHKEEMERIEEILSIPQPVFFEFIDYCFELQKQTLRLIKNNPKGGHDVLKAIFINYHSLKAFARSHQLKLLTDQIHQAEQICKDVTKSINSWNQENMLTSYQKVQEIIERYRYLSEERLGLSRRNSLQDKGQALEKIHLLIKTLEEKSNFGDPQLNLLVRELQHELPEVSGSNKAITKIINEVAEQIPSISAELGKAPSEIVIDSSGHILIGNKEAQVLKGALLHLLRNSLDHGIEPDETRLLAGKSRIGKIHIRVSKDQGITMIRFEDDGQGLDLASFQARVDELGLITGSQRSEQDILNLLFHPGFTTKETVSSISGQGMGLAAIKSALQDIGASISVELQKQDKTAKIHLAFVIQLRTD